VHVNEPLTNGLSSSELDMLVTAGEMYGHGARERDSCFFEAVGGRW